MITSGSSTSGSQNFRGDHSAPAAGGLVDRGHRRAPQLASNYQLAAASGPAVRATSSGSSPAWRSRSPGGLPRGPPTGAFARPGAAAHPPPLGRLFEGCGPRRDTRRGRARSRLRLGADPLPAEAEALGLLAREQLHLGDRGPLNEDGDGTDRDNHCADNRRERADNRWHPCPRLRVWVLDALTDVVSENRSTPPLLEEMSAISMAWAPPL